MLTLQVKEQIIENLTPDEKFIRGTVGAKCQIKFDEFWSKYEKTVVFQRKCQKPINIIVNELDNEIEIPYEILEKHGKFKIGVFGIIENEVLPTLWSTDIEILCGTDTHGTNPQTYTPSEIDQLRLSKQDKLIAGSGITIENNVISSGGITDYELLENKPQINGVELLGNKSLTDLGIDIPTKTSELENDSGFIDDTALENYYTKTEVDEKTVVDQTYNKNSQNAQSGIAVAEAVEPKLDKPSMPPTVGNVLKVLSLNEDGTFTCEWSDAPSGGAVDDVRINEESIVNEGIANIPIATNKKSGVIKVGNGLFINNLGNLIVSKAENGSIDSRNNSYNPIVPSNIDYAVKAAMCDGNGTEWTEEEKTAARTRIGVDTILGDIETLLGGI